MSTTSSPRLRNLLLAVGAAVALIAAAIPSAAYAWGRWGHHQPAQSVEDVREHLSYGAEKLANLADATDEQERAIDAVLDEMAPRIFAHSREARDLRARLMTELGKEKVDRTELERLRVEGIALADRASREAVGAVADLSDILTPAQRADLIGLWSRWSR